MTWKEFKEKVEAAGVKDEDRLGIIDSNIQQGPNPEWDDEQEVWNIW